MKNNLVIYPSNQFYLNNLNNIFIDRFVSDQYYENINHSNESQYVITKIDSKTRKENFSLADRVFYEILDCIKNEFNFIFKNNFDIKFYEIIIGPWLRYFVYQFINKYKTILSAINNHSIDMCTIYDTSELLYFFNNTELLSNAANDNKWNAGIYSYILENLNTKIKFKKIILEDKILYNSIIKKKKKNKVYNFLNYLSDKIPNYSNGLIYRTGFGGHGFYYEKKLEVTLKQIPRYYKLDFEYNISKYNLNFRSKFNFEKFQRKDSYNHNNEFVKVCDLILGILSKSIPIIFIEDFNYMMNFSDKLNFPKKPQFILTSFAHETIEPFKFYLACQKFKNKKLKYFIYQHGSSFITSIDSSYGHVFKTADFVIIWGKTKDPIFKNIISHQNFKLLDKRYFADKQCDDILIFMRSSGSNLSPYDIYSEKINKINLMLEFLKKIDNKFKSKIIIRAHPNAKKIFRKYDDFFNINDHKYKLDYGKIPYFKALNRAKLIIFGYDSSGILEAIIANKPFVCLWPNLFEHLNEFVKADYKLLKEVKILFDNPDELSEHIKNNWENLNDWWLEEDTQRNLKKFSENFSIKPDKNFYKNLNKMLIN